jgi:hypothetical protein
MSTSTTAIAETVVADTTTAVEIAPVAAVASAAASKKKKKEAIDVREMLTTSSQALDLTLKTQKMERLASEKAQKFVNFMRMRLDGYEKTKTVTVLSYISGKFGAIEPAEERAHVIELFNERLEWLCLCIDHEEKPVERPKVLDQIYKFFQKNGIEKTTETCAQRYDCDMPLVHLYTMLLASCKMTQELKPCVTALVLILIDLPKYLKKHEALKTKHEETTAERTLRATRGRPDLARLTAEELTSWCIEHDCDGEKAAAWAREWRLFHDKASAADKEHAEKAKLLDAKEDDEGSDGSDDDDEDDEDEGGDENDFDDDDNLEDLCDEEVTEALEMVTVAEKVTMEKFTELFAKMITSDDIYKMDVQKKTLVPTAKKTAAVVAAATMATKRKAEEAGVVAPTDVKEARSNPVQEPTIKDEQRAVAAEVSAKA